MPGEFEHVPSVPLAVTMAMCKRRERSTVATHKRVALTVTVAVDRGDFAALPSPQLILHLVN